MLAKKPFTLKELLEVLHDLESTKDEMLEADSNLERNMIIQGTKRMCAQYRKLYDSKKASTVQTTLEKFVAKKNKIQYNRH